MDTVTTLGKLETIVRFVNAHGDGRAEINGLTVRIYSEYSHFVNGDLVWSEMYNDVRTMREARDVLGY